MSFISKLGVWLSKVHQSFANASIDGRNITLTRHNGNTVVLTTLDTTYGEASSSVAGLMSATDKIKLDNIAEGAEPNQFAYSNIKVGNETITADRKTATVELIAGTAITLTPNATNDSVTIDFAQPYGIELTPPSTSFHGGYVDFHYNGSSSDFTSRIIEIDSGFIDVNGLVFKRSVNSASVKTGHLMLSSDTSYMRISAGTDDEVGANLLLTGPNYTDETHNYLGMFSLAAKDNTDECVLRGSPDGTLSWGSDYVLTTATGLQLTGGTLTGRLSGTTLSMSGNISGTSIELSAPTPFIDFHFDSSTADYTSRIIETASGVLNINGLKFSTNKRIYSTSSNDVVRLSAGTTDATDGGYIALYGSGQGWSGNFVIGACNGQGTTVALRGTPSGTLLWGGKDVVRAEASASGKLKLSDGTMIQWGSKASSSSAVVTETFSEAFLTGTAPSVSIHFQSGSLTSVTGQHLRSILVSDISNTGFKFVALGYAGSGSINAVQGTCRWIAIGRWK